MYSEYHLKDYPNIKYKDKFWKKNNKFDASKKKDEDYKKEIIYKNLEIK